MDEALLWREQMLEAVYDLNEEAANLAMEDEGGSTRVDHRSTAARLHRSNDPTRAMRIGVARNRRSAADDSGRQLSCPAPWIDPPVEGIDPQQCATRR